MARDVFVDSGAWVAISVVRDDHHHDAAATFRRLLRQPCTLTTTNLVVGESYALIQRAGGHATAMRFLQILRQTSRVRKVYSVTQLEDQAELILGRYADQDFSFVDAVSFAVMRQHGITEAFAFDHHFLTAGFTLLTT